MPIAASSLHGEAGLRKACHSSTRQILLLLMLLVTIPASAQGPQTTGEAKLNSGETSAGTTTVGGYGNMLFRRDVNAGLSTIDMERVVLFVGHRFSKSISFLSELEVEHAKVEGGEEGGEVALEQAYVKFDFDSRHYLVAGLFIPRIGIINENHLPIDFNGNERPIVERLVIPTTWRELGVGFYGSLEPIGMRYTLGLMNGLNSSAFSNGSLIRGGRAEGSRASANNLALTGAAQFDRGPVTLQISGYYGGTVGVASEEADTLGLESGIFGTPVAMGEADLQYSSNGLSLKALGVVVSIPDADQINAAYDNDTPELGYGAYFEAGYDLFRLFPDRPAGELVNGSVRIPLSSFGPDNMVIVQVSSLPYDLAVRRDGSGNCAAYLLKCTHADTQLIPSGDSYHCSLHGSRFDLDGKVRKGPASKDLERYPAVESDGIVIVTIPM